MAATQQTPIVIPAYAPGWLARFLQNPVLQAELRHQWHVIETSRSGRGWIAVALLMLIPALLASLVYFFGGVVGWRGLPVVPVVDGGLFSFVFAVGWLLMVTMNVALYVVVLLVTLGLSASSITRERTGKTWDNLVLTNMDSRRIVLGKWWASVIAMWGDHLMIGLLRLGLVAWLVISYERYLGLPPAAFSLPAHIGYIPLLTLIVCAYTVLDATFTTALGVAIPLSEWPGAVVTVIVLGARLTATAAAVIWLMGMIHLIRTQGGLGFVPLGVGGLVGFALLTWAALRVAMWFAVRGQVSPPAQAAEQ